MHNATKNCHHHPHVLRDHSGSWQWDCACGAHGVRTMTHSWRCAVTGALVHSSQISG